MTEQNPEEQPAQDEADEFPDEMVGEEVEPEHGLDVDSFEEEDDEDDLPADEEGEQ